MFRVEEIDWSFASIEHIARHGVEPEEVDEVVFGRPIVARSRKETYRLIGQTGAGRLLTVILAPRGAGVFAVVTARDATGAERRAFRRG
jgi:uncharacterized DUF497 family protein